MFLIQFFFKFKFFLIQISLIQFFFFQKKFFLIYQKFYKIHIKYISDHMTGIVIISQINIH